MKYINIFLFLMSLGSSATEISYYEQLEQKINIGYKPEISSVIGWHSGRCFQKNDDRVISALLVIHSTSYKNLGPLFSSSIEADDLKMLILSDGFGNPDKSELNQYEFLNSSLISSINATLKLAFSGEEWNVTEDDYSLLSGKIYDGRPAIRLTTQGSSDYLFANIFGNREDSYNCYFYNKVK